MDKLCGTEVIPGLTGPAPPPPPPSPSPPPLSFVFLASDKFMQSIRTVLFCKCKFRADSGPAVAVTESHRRAALRQNCAAITWAKFTPANRHRSVFAAVLYNVYRSHAARFSCTEVILVDSAL